MDIPMSALLDRAEEEILKKSLPDGIYRLEWVRPHVYEVLFLKTLLAVISVQNGNVHFKFGVDPRAITFRDALYANYPEHNPDKVVWGVFYHWRGKWAFSGDASYETMDDAFYSVTNFETDNGAFVCSYRRSDWGSDGLNLKTLTSCRVLKNEANDGDFTLGPNDGPIKIEFTNEENFVIPPGGVLGLE